MTQAIVRRDNRAAELRTTYEGLGMMPPAVKVAIAADWAKSLMEVVEQKKLYQLIGGKKFLQAEAWELIGSFDETTAETHYEPIVEDETIVGYKGISVLRRRGEPVGGAEGSCYLDASVCRGKQGRSIDRAAQSAAQTWAAAKALRIKYSYVAVLGGYEPTPAEEMTGIDFDRPSPDHRQARRPVAPPAAARQAAPAKPQAAAAGEAAAGPDHYDPVSGNDLTPDELPFDSRSSTVVDLQAAIESATTMAEVNQLAKDIAKTDLPREQKVALMKANGAKAHAVAEALPRKERLE